MEFHVRLIEPVADLDTIEDAIVGFDPAAQVDIDDAGRNLRVAGYIESADLVSLLQRAGYPVAPSQVVEIPAVCCGGCGG